MPSAPPTSTGFVPLASYLNANRDAANNTATGLAQDATNAGNAAMANDRKVGDEAQAGYAQGGGAGNPNYDPSNLADWASAQSQQDKAQDQIAGLGSEAGVASELGAKYGAQGGYTAGDRALDASLTDTADAKAQFKGVQDQFSGLGDYLNQQAKSRYVAPPTPDQTEARPLVDDPNTVTPNPGSAYSDGGSSGTYQNYIKPSILNGRGKKTNDQGGF